MRIALIIFVITGSSVFVAFTVFLTPVIMQMLGKV
jgi:hypothetical protein